MIFRQKEAAYLVGRKLKNTRVCNMCNANSAHCKEVRDLTSSPPQIVHIVCRDCLKKLREDASQTISMTKECIEKTYGVEL